MSKRKRNLLVIVDMQKDFVTGPLGTKEAEAIVPGIRALIERWKTDYPNTVIICTRDTHTSDYLNTQEGELLPIPHTIEGYPGHDIVPEIMDVLPENTLIFDKPIFGSHDLYTYIRNQANNEDRFTHVYFVGVCTGICIISNAVLARTADPELSIHVVNNLCACATPESHEAAIKAMLTLQIFIENGR